MCGCRRSFILYFFTRLFDLCSLFVYCVHHSGREDIDVRMLGNGRPFVVEVLEAKEAPTQEIIQQAVDFVSAGRGLNVDQDVDVLILEEVSE